MPSNYIVKTVIDKHNLQIPIAFSQMTAIVDIWSMDTASMGSVTFNAFSSQIKDTN